MAIFKSGEAKKKVIKIFGRVGKIVRVDGSQQKKVPNFSIFWPTYHKRLATPAIQYTLYIIPPIHIHSVDQENAYFICKGLH